MAFVFRPIEPVNITKTFFYANKLWQLENVSVPDLTNPATMSVDPDVSMSIYYGRYQTSSWILSSSEETTTNGQYSRTIWHSVNQLYYRNFQMEPYEHALFGSVGVESRDITEKIQVFSIPTKIIGRGIKPGSFELLSGSKYFFDDGHGNILGYDTGLTSGEIDSSSFNSNLKDFYFCSFYFKNGFYNKSKLGSYTSLSHGMLGSAGYYNLDSDLGVPGPVHGPKKLTAYVNNLYTHDSYTGPVSSYASEHYLDFDLQSAYTGSAYVRIRNNKYLNFKTDDQFTISFWMTRPLGMSNVGSATATVGNPSGSLELISKFGRGLVRRLPTGTDAGVVRYMADAPDLIVDEIQGGPYPFKIEMINSGSAGAGKIRFSRSDGSVVSSVTSSIALTTDDWYLITCRKSGSALQIFINDTLRGEVSQSCSAFTTNRSDIFIGCRGDLINTSSRIPIDNNNRPYNGSSQFSGKIGTVHFFDRVISNEDISFLSNTSDNASDPKYHWGLYNNRYGNIFYNDGNIVWTNGRDYDVGGNTVPDIFKGSSVEFDFMKFRSTKLITTTEVICTIGPNELNMTSNPTILIRTNGNCNPGIGFGETGVGNDDGECYSFVTASFFSPYITTIGLYNDAGELLVAGKLSSPVKKPTNCDITFVVKWDS